MLGCDDDARLPRIDARERTARIAKLNDMLRRYPVSGRLAVTAGVIALGEGALPVIIEQVAAYDRFDEDNDPYGEHDFGSFEHAGNRLFWRVDYYDRAMRYGSSDPANPSVTTRVLTIMLAGEY